MRIIQVKALENGAHHNQVSENLLNVPNGWAVIPDDMVTDNFPFGDITTEEVEGVMTVTSWVPKEVPEDDAKKENS